MKPAIDTGVSPRSAHAWASSAAMSSVTSRDQPSAVLKATMLVTNTGLKQVTDQCSAVGIGLIRFAPGAA